MVNNKELAFFSVDSEVSVFTYRASGADLYGVSW